MARMTDVDPVRGHLPTRGYGRAFCSDCHLFGEYRTAVMAADGGRCAQDLLAANGCGLSVVEVKAHRPFWTNESGTLIAVTDADPDVHVGNRSRRRKFG